METPEVEPIAEVPVGITVNLTKEEWHNALGLIELGVKAAGAQAFIAGGVLIQKVVEQLPKE